MTKLEEIQAAEARLLIHTYDRFPVLFVAGEGVHLIDENGDRYLDLLSGIGVNALGYGSKVIEEAIAKQSRTLINASNLLLQRGTWRSWPSASRDHRHGSRLLWQLRLRSRGRRAQAGPRSRRLLREEGKQIGTKFLALEQSFHGRTFGAISTTYKEKYREPFEPVVPGFEFVKFNDVADLRAKFSNEVCAILVEAIQGEGGVRPLTQEFFAEARALADSTGALLIVDEIQAGMGRTGKWCAYQHYGIQARHHHAGQASGRRHSHGRDSLHGRGRARLPCRHARHHLWRRPAGLRRRHRRHRRHRKRKSAGHATRSATTSRRNCEAGRSATSASSTCAARA
jgi:acetylornithine/N-succinyldiaminopimelate aminotransferase